jgi:predicted nucleic acid-binding protein
MIHGLDTGFLVAAEVREHAEHAAARDTLARLLAQGDRIAIAPTRARAESPASLTLFASVQA